MYDTALIKSRISCVDVAQRCGLPIQKSGDRCVSPLRLGASNPSSFAVDDDFWYDFGDSKGGDAIDLLAALKYNGDRGAAIRELGRLTGVADDNAHDDSQAWVDYTNALNARTAYYHSQLTDDDRSYLHSRGLSEATIDALMLGRVTDGGLLGRLFIPYHHPGGYVSYYATRVLPGSAYPENKYMKQRKDDHCQHIPWGLTTLGRSGDTLVIAEGAFDAISFYQEGYPVLSAITGSFSKTQLPTVISAARKFSRVLIVYDDDSATSNAGERFTARMSTILTRNRVPFVVGTVPPPYHDVSDYYAAGGDLSVIINNAEPGLQYVASRITDFGELEKFLYDAARHTKRSDLDAVFAHLKRVTDYDPKRLDNLYKSVTNPPPENIVADEIMQTYQLLYVDSVGFYEYTNGYWCRRSDGAINAYVDKTLGTFSTYNRVRSVTGLLKTRVRRDVTFNERPLWNFVNGTLELDTGVFRDHNPNDYCSFQASYPYNPDATYNGWSRFIDDVTAGDPRSAELLQFIPAYALYHDCSLERIFVLQGLGSNGKSKYLEIIRQLFGEQNVSHITPRGLLDKFQRISLRESLINIAGEIRSDLRDVEELLKSIASGEPQSACYKGEQFVTFVPRTKLVFATNSQLSSGDTSEGLTRRLILIDFKVSFVDCPDPSDPYQRQKNTEIITTLAQELATGGIFNWVYEGYKLLRAVGYFTETNDQAELIQDFKRASNPILVFWEEREHTPAEYEHPQAYEDYKRWCADNGYPPVGSTTFHREFRLVAAPPVSHPRRSCLWSADGSWQPPSPYGPALRCRCRSADRQCADPAWNSAD